MCFVINPKYPKEKIAKRDIVCYKRLVISLTGDFLSPYQGKPYKLNILYRSRLEPTSYDIINIGLHSYSCKKYAMNHLIKYCREVLTKGIIPKGSRYYYNPYNHEYVSNRIIIQEVIK